MRNRIVLLFLIVVPSEFFSVRSEGAEVTLEAEGEGEITVQGALINAEGNVKYGLDEKQLEVMFKAQEESIVSKLKESDGIKNEEESLLLKRKLQDAQAKLAEIKKSYEEELLRRKAADAALAEMKDQLPEEQIRQALAHLSQGDTEAAEKAFDSVVDKEDNAIALAAYQSGQLAKSRWDYDKALRQYNKAVALEENNPEYLLAAGQMARTMADYSYAEKWLERLLKIREASGDELALARVQHELAWVYEDQKRYEEAEPLYQRSLAIWEKSLGKDHPHLAVLLNNIAGLYESQGRYEEAEPLYQQAIAIMKKKFPSGHPNLDIFQQNYDELKRKMAE